MWSPAFFVRFCSLDVRSNRSSFEIMWSCVWDRMVNSVDLIQTCGQGYGVAVVTSCSPLLLLVIDTTSKACTHARRSHSRKNTHSTIRYVRLCGESVRYCYSLCFCWRYTVDSVKQQRTSIWVSWRIWCKALSWWAQYDKRYAYAKSQKRISSWKAQYKTRFK